MSHDTHRQPNSLPENIPPLLKAAADGQYGEVVRLLIDNGEDVNKSDEAGHTSLMLAASQGHNEIVVRLLRAGANVQKQDSDGGTALHHACVSGHLEVVRTLMNKEPSLVNQGDDVEHTPLMLAASQGHLQVVNFLTTMPVTMVYKESKKHQTALQLAYLKGHLIIADTLLNAGHSIDECDECGRTPLMLAASEGNDEAVTRLVSAGANVHQQDGDGGTALHHACVSGHLEVVRTLMNKEPSLVNQGDDVEHTPLMLAASRGHHEIVNFLTSRSITKVHKESASQQTALLLAYFKRHWKIADTLLNSVRASIDECDESGLTPLMLAASEGHDWIVTHFLSAGANVQKQDRDGRTALHHSCVSGHLEVVRTLMNKEPSLVNLGDEVEHTPLMLAASRGHHEIVNFLTAMPVTKVHKKSANRQTALHLTCLRGHLKAVDALLHAGASIDECDESGLTPLMLAASEGHDWIVTHFLSAGANVQKQDRDGRTALHHSCVSGHLEVVRTLMNKEPSLVNLGDEVEHTPLMLAASRGHHEIVNFLTAMPVTKVHKKSANRQTALHLTCLRGHLKAVDLLLHAGASIDECDESGLTPLMLAASEGHDWIVTHFLSAGANVQKQDRDGRTALHHSCVSGHLEVVRTLMNKEPSLVNLGDEVEHTPLMLAASRGHHEIVNFLTAMPVTKVHKKSANRQTALHLTCLRGHLKAVDLLLHAGASIDECDESGFTPLMLAASEGHDWIVTHLLSAGANVHKQDNDGRRALHFATKQGTKLSVSKLLYYGAEIDHKDIYGHTSLTIAAIKWQYGLAIHLIQAGADVTQLTKPQAVGRDLADEVVWFAIQDNLTENMNCHYFCALFQQDSGVSLQNWDIYKQAVATLILRQLYETDKILTIPGSSLLSTDPPMTELMWSTCKGYESLVMYLILQGVDVNAQNPHGDTALHFAAQGNHIQCGLLLAKAGTNVRTTNKLSQTPFVVSSEEFRNGILEMLSFQTKKICCVLGNALHGKSTLIASLQNENASRFNKFRHRLFGVRNISQRTAGIEPVSLRSKRYGNVLFYDFAGQHQYHGPHELFLESIISRGLSSVAVIAVVNITEEQSVMFQQLNRWLQPFYKPLPSTTNPIPVILVGSHLDKAKRQAEAKCNLEICFEQLKNQGHSVSLQFVCICCLDCRKPYAPDIQKLCKYLLDVPLPLCEDSRTGYSLPWVISQIRSSFTEEVLPSSAFAAWICQNKANLPTNLPPAEDVCRDLASTGHFLYLSSKIDASDGWLVLDLPSILKDVYGNLLSSGKSNLKVSKVGLLSCAKLPTIFPRFEPSLVRSILISLGFGVEVDPSFLTEATLGHLMERSDREHEHLFIPALVTENQPNVFADIKESAPTCCWQFKVDEKLFLSPRILQAVILRLAGHYVFLHKQGSEVKPLSHRVWSNGIFWKSLNDADVAVQISDNAAIHVIGCSEVSAEALCRYMSTVVQGIARTINSIDPNIHGSAYIISPQAANPQFLLKNPRPPAHQKFPIDAIVRSIRNGSETTLSLDHDSPNSTGERKSISELFGGLKPSLEAIQDFFVLQDSTAQPTDPSSGSTASTEPHPNQVLPTTERTDTPGASDHTGMLDGTTLATPTDSVQFTPTGPTLTTRTGPDLTSHNVAEDVRREITGHTAITSTTAAVTLNEDILAIPIDPSLTLPIDPTVTTPTDSTLTTPTGPILTPPTNPLLSFPNMETLDLFVVYEVAARWQHVGIHLGMTSALRIIHANYPSNVVQCCHDMFSNWLFSEKGTGEKTRTWESVLSALEKANYSNVAADLRRELDPAS